MEGEGEAVFGRLHAMLPWPLDDSSPTQQHEEVSLIEMTLRLEREEALVAHLPALNDPPSFAQSLSEVHLCPRNQHQSACNIRHFDFRSHITNATSSKKTEKLGDQV